MSISQPLELSQNVGSKLPFVNKNFWFTEVGVFPKVQGFVRQSLVVGAFASGWNRAR